MALSASVLALAIKTALLADARTQATDDTALPDDQKSLTPFCEAIAGAVVDHIIALGLVTVAPGIPVTTAGTALAQTGVTTAPGVGSIS